MGTVLCAVLTLDCAEELCGRALIDLLQKCARECIDICTPVAVVDLIAWMLLGGFYITSKSHTQIQPLPHQA